MQLFSATSTALQFLHRTETANSPLEAHWGEPASPKIRHGKVSWKRTPTVLQEGSGRQQAPAQPPSTTPTTIQASTGAKMNPRLGRFSQSLRKQIPLERAQVWLQSHREMHCLPSALSVWGSVSWSQECIQNIPWIESITCLWGAQLHSKVMTHLSRP